jgi:hypothetical protein
MDTDALVERWWNDHFPGSVLGHHTEVWNHVFAAKDELKARLRQLAALEAPGSEGH